ncbi:DNRLRE domain-containing protein [Asanoa sp. WMMD1127]|uniref:DNRLRE domain-containing protein n=1 Tax=Asanoa sp. WMMD1127 TaxID=3016107 RepID=UPI0024163562|nr:DNRLRE domain-containing protein [Asanoa sp. WMMD1127]MDG4822020.1 DNRLRE domain-containing protein [Asanoa sp. WMMD1127]
MDNSRRRRYLLTALGAAVLALVLIATGQSLIPRLGESGAGGGGRDRAERAQQAQAQTQVRGREVPETPPGPGGMLPHPARLPAGKAIAAVKRVAEDKAARTANAKVYKLADGRRQSEVSTHPVHYRDADGRWQDIDTTVRKSDTAGWPYEVNSNAFRSAFGDRSDRLARFDLGGRSITMGVDGAPRAIKPKASKSEVRFPAAFPQADLVYDVTPTLLKEKIVLQRPPTGAAAYTFTLDLDGVVAEQQSDGSIAFRASTGDTPVFYLPKPFMYDAAADKSTATGSGWSSAVKQTLTGDRLTITADADWLRSPDRRYPVVIDPTIKVQPQVGQAQDAMINSYEPTTNYDSLWRLSVGTNQVNTTTKATFRSLVKFPMTEVPAGTKLDSAQLKLYFDQTMVNANDPDTVPIQAHRVTANWAENTVTWNNIQAALGEQGSNTELVDNADSGKTAAGGEWPSTSNAAALNGAFRSNSGATTGDTFTWVPRVTETGSYEVQVHYVPGADRATAAPYTIHHAGGSTPKTVNQTTGSGNGAWVSLGSYTFNAGTTHKVVLGDVANKVVVGDGVRLIKRAADTKTPLQQHAWHNFSVRSIVQDWIDNKQPNYGFMVKTANEATVLSGPRYEGAENAYGGEVDTFPTLLLTWGRPGVTLQMPTTIRSTGAELAWSAYTDPSPGTTTPDDIVEYQVHRSNAQSFIPSAKTLVAPVIKERTNYSDTSGTPTAANNPTEFGAPFYYMIVVKTRDGQLIPSPTEQVQLPKAGHIVRVLQGNSTDTTLTSKQPTTGHDVLDGGGLVQIGNNGSIFGTSRTVVKWPSMAGLPAGTKVLSAKVGLWGAYSEGGTGATFNMHGLTRDFDEATASWNRASTATAWTTAGGDYTAAATSAVTNIGLDPRWQNWNATSLVQGWVNNPTSNKGVLFRLANETTPTQRVLFTSGEVPDIRQRPRLEVVYTAPATENTYYAPTVPSRMIPGDEYTSPVSITNTVSSTLAKADWVLSYRWELADGTDVTTPDNQRETPLPVDLTSGAVTTVQAKIMTPVRTDQGNKRRAFVLKWDLRNKTTGQWLSQVWEIPPLAQRIAVEDPTSDQLGLEKFYQYTGENAGAGSTVMVNQFSGNAVFSYNAFSNPSRGSSTFVRLSYNSQDSSNSYVGYGWSLSTSTVQRLGSPLVFAGGDARWPAKITLTDGDGTSHFFDLNKHNSTNEADWDYDNPAGVHLYLQRNPANDPVRTWVMTRPDRSQFYFDADGYQTAIIDKNGNDLLFTYERTNIGNRNTGVLKYLTDSTGRRTLTFEYFNTGDSYQYFVGNTKQNGTNLANAQIVNQLRSIVDITGRRITLTYSDRGTLRQVIDGQGTPDEKPFGFYYDDSLGITNPKLVRVDDPRGNGTKVAYFPQSSSDLLRWRAQKVTDRVDNATEFDYSDPDGSTGSYIESVVTDANGHASTYKIDGYGRPELLTNAKQQKTELTWDADNNVRRMQEDNGAVTSWVYDENTGLPLEIRDPEANKNNTAPQKLGYRFGLKGHTAELTEKTSPEGRKYTFGYDTYGNLTSVTDPNGTATTTAGDYTSVYTYDTWGQQLTSTDANDNTTKYSEYDPVGYPRKITDALNQVETYEYDAIGNVVSITDANSKTSQYTYDTFGRPLSSRVPKDAANNVYIFTPGPTYDGNDNVIREEQANGAVKESGHDPADRLAFVTEPKDTSTGPERTTTLEYDAVGNLVAETEPKGTLTADPNDYVTRYRYDELNQLVEGTDPKGGNITADYDNVGNLKSIADQRKSATTDPNDFNEKYDYDLNRRATVVTDADGFTNKTEFDRDGNATAVIDQDNNRTVLVYDPRGMLIEQRVPHNGSVVRTTAFEYDEVGNQTRVISPRGTETTDTRDFATESKYDVLNRLKEQLEPYNDDDERVTTPDSTIYTYDKLGNIKTVEAPPSEGESNRTVTSYAYWDNSWTKTSTDPWNIRTDYDYDVIGNQTSRKVTGGSKNRQMNWTFFPDGKQKTQSDDGDGATGGARKSFAFSYDANANLSEMLDNSADAKIDKYSIAYDVLNRVDRIEERFGGSLKNTTRFEYDTNSNLLKRFHDKTYAEYKYNNRDLVETVTNGKSESDSAKKTTTFTYTKRRQVATEKKGNNNTVTYEYFLDQALRHQVEKKQNTTVVSEHTLEYDANGNRTKDIGKKQNADNKSSMLDTTTTYKYDPRDRIREQVATGHGAGTEKYVHDANNNVIDQTIKGTRTTFDYDRNRLNESTTSGIRSTYRYDDFGRLESVTAADTEIERYTYDGFDRTKTHKRTPGGTTEYTYDPLDRQLTRKQNDKTTTLSYLGLSEQVLAEEEGGKLRKSYNYDAQGQLLSQQKFKDDGSFEESYQGYNAQSDVEQLTDEQGDSRATYGYTAYGKNDGPQFTGVDKPDAGNPEDPNREPYNAYRFNGKRFDQSSGDYDMGFRDYDPGLNRFLTQDNYNGALDDMNLATDPFTNNRYAFGGGNPVSQVEIDGHFSLSDIGHAALDVAGLVPGVGEVADLANAAWYAAEGDYANAALSAASAIPFAGYAASAVKGAKYAAKGVDAAQSAAKAADGARSGAKAADTATSAGKAAPSPGKAASGGGGPTGGARASGGGGSAGPAKAGGSGGPAKASGGTPARGGGGNTAASRGGNCLSNSFVPGTAVLMADGSYKAIEEVRVGDEVLATDPELGVSAARPVDALITGTGEKRLVEITVDTGRLVATDGHPFWVDDQGRFVAAKDLRPGDLVATPDGGELTVIATRQWTEARTVHNLTVNGIHTYYVAAGAASVLVHNCGTPQSARGVADHLRTLGSPYKVLVIGRTMTRVNDAAAALRAEGVGHVLTYKPWKNDPWDNALALRRNTRWIKDKMREGYEIVDIGPDLGRKDPFGDFYGMEARETAGYGSKHLMRWPAS